VLVALAGRQVRGAVLLSMTSGMSCTGRLLGGSQQCSYHRHSAMLQCEALIYSSTPATVGTAPLCLWPD
jgi:hypothetical protein